MVKVGKRAILCAEEFCNWLNRPFLLVTEVDAGSQSDESKIAVLAFELSADLIVIIYDREWIAPCDREIELIQVDPI